MTKTMHIGLSPQRRPEPMTLSRQGDVLTINGEAFDFAPLPEGAALPREAIASSWFAGPVTREGGALHLTLILPHGTVAPRRTRFPQPVVVDDDGPVALPPYTTPEGEDPDPDEEDWSDVD